MLAGVVIKKDQSQYLLCEFAIDISVKKTYNRQFKGSQFNKEFQGG